MRRFVGLALPGAVQDALTAAMTSSWSGGADVAWTRPTGWHVTLAYVGETDAEPEDLAAVLGPAVAAHAPGTLRLGAPTWFDRAWVLAVVDDPDGWCAAVGETAQEALAAAGHDPVRRRVRPHLTLARRRGRRGSDRASEVVLPAPDVGGVPVWTADHLAVFTSVTGDGPARYPVGATVPLGA